MEDRKFRKIVIAVTAVCLALTVAHFIYAANAYEHCSIIHFVGKELW